MSADLSDAKTEVAVSGSGTVDDGEYASASASVDSAELADMVGTDSEFEGVPDMLEPGHEIAGRYKIVRHLGDGGMGNVYLAEHTAIKKLVALKTLSVELSKRKVLRERFLREARSASKINHPNVVDITDYGSTDEGAPFIAMEFLDGEDLKQMLRREGRITFERARDLVVQICAALQAAHDQDIVHRDVKPANCFCVQQSGSFDLVKVVDFGIAKTMANNDTAELTKTGVIVGTAAYMSPEQARGDADLDARADVYSVGVILFRMLSGRLPYNSSSPLGMITRHLTDPVPSLREVAPEAELSPAVDKIVQKALAKDRDQRWQSATELAAALEAVTEPHAVAPRRDLWIGATLIAILLVAGVGFALRDSLALDPAQAADPSPDTAAAKARARARARARAQVRASARVGPEPEVPVAPASKTVGVTLEGAPEGARVFVGDRELGSASEVLVLDRGEGTVTLEIVAPGYEPEAVSFVPVADLTVPVTLEPTSGAKKVNKTKKKAEPEQDKPNIDKELGL